MKCIIRFFESNGVFEVHERKGNFVLGTFENCKKIYTFILTSKDITLQN